MAQASSPSPSDKDGNALTLADLGDGAGAVTIGKGAGEAKSIDDLVNRINSLDDGLSAPVLQAKLNDAGQLEIKTLNGGNFSINVVGDNTDGTTSETTSSNLALAQALGLGSAAQKVADGGLTAGAQNYDVRVTSAAAASLTSKALYSAGNTLAKAIKATAIGNVK